jgi:hypothetical protein
LMLELVTTANVIGGYPSCRLANKMQVSEGKIKLVAGEGFEPSKAEPGDLQSPPIGRSGNPPRSNK